MIDPLSQFDWGTLYARYDAMSKRGFNGSSKHLNGIEPRPVCDRALYSHLLKAAHAHQSGSGRFSLPEYEAVLYWKLYSNHQAMANLGRWFQSRQAVGTAIDHLVRSLPRELPREPHRVVTQVQSLGEFQVMGIKAKTAIPTRTTLLHFFYPNVVPIFDKMVLQAVGITKKGANQSIDMFRKYLSHVWFLAERYTTSLNGFGDVSSVRLVDMALWVIRGKRGSGRDEECAA
jgi:hypothetical protein